jgi:putative oxidoreductase
MLSQLTQLLFFDRYKDYGPFFIRLLIGTFIIYGVQDNVFSHERMVEFANFLAACGFPYPMFGAYLSAYTQFICGISTLLGFATRLLAIPFIINFLFALVLAHRGDSFNGMFPALVMVFIGLSFLFSGAGKLSIDHYLRSRKSP